MGFELFAALDFDWRLAVDSRAAKLALRRWRGDPALGRLRRLDDILKRTARGADRRDANAVLAALLQRAKTDEMAARAALQALAPGLTNVAKRMGAARDPDIAAEVVAVALAKIKGYPCDRRPRAVAANLVLDVLNALWHSYGPQGGGSRERCVAPDHLARVPDPAPDAATTRPTGRDVLEVVADSGQVPAEQLTLVADAVLDRVTVPIAAARAGISEKAMWRRRDRARATVVRAYRLAQSA